jgi:peptidyl-Lys metalloendopeptidase
MKLILKYFISAALSVMLITVVDASTDLPEGIEVSASVSKTLYGLDDDLMVSVTYRNMSDQTIKLLTWSTALNGGLTEDLFSVEFLGQQIPYVGIHAKRLAPIDSDYTELAAGQSASASINLLRSYPINFKGEYHIAIRESGALNRKKLSPLSIKLSADRPTVEAKRAPSFQNCSVKQRSLIDSALGSAERIANIAIQDLRAAPVNQRVNARRYRQWFGAYEAGRYARVENGMAKIASALSNQIIGFDCDCTGQPSIDPSRTFAFVFPNDPYNITLCGVFFQVPRDGTDSKSGTIVHEVSHFTVVADSDDFSSAFDQGGS